MIADSVEELIEFAVGMGLRREWYQAKSSPHYDLTVEGRELAVSRGAISMNQREFVLKLREIRGNVSSPQPDVVARTASARDARDCKARPIS